MAVSRLGRGAVGDALLDGDLEPYELRVSQGARVSWVLRGEISFARNFWSVL